MRHLASLSRRAHHESSSMGIARRRAAGFVTIWVAVLAIQTASAFGQTILGEISGTVQDEQHGLLPAALLAVRNLDTGGTREGVSDRAGAFHIYGLPPGRYELTVTLAGFAAYSRQVDLTIGERADLAAVLRLALAVGVDVKAADPRAGFLTGPAGRTFTTREIDDLPLAGRNFANLALLAPGILVNQVAAGSSTGIAAAAQTGKNNTFLIDGVTLDDTINGANRGSLSSDAIREFVVMSNGFGAEFGQASGAIVAIATRSGTNDRHARLFYYHRDQRWDAPSFAARLVSPPLEDSPFEQKIAGGFLGGPIKRNRAFYFASVDHTLVDSEAIITSPVLQTFKPGAAGQIPVTQRVPKVFGRLDLAPTHLGMFTVRYRLHRASMTNSLGAMDVGSAAPERAFNVTTNYQDIALLHNATKGTSRFNEFRLQLSRGGFDRLDPACVGCWEEDRPSIRLGKLSLVPNELTEDRLQLADTVTSFISSSSGEHALKTGIDISTIRADIRGLGNRDGTYSFQKNGDLPFNRNDPKTYPARYTQTIGAEQVQLTHQLYGAFVQDRWNPRPNVTLNLGVRWDHDSGPAVSGDWRDLATRVDAAWIPARLGQTSIRAGYGRDFDQVPLSIAASVTQTDYLIDIQDPGYPDPFGFNPNRTIDPSSQAPSRVQLVDLQVPHNDVLSVGARRTMSNELMLSVDVVTARGRRLLVSHDLNYPDLVSLVRPDPNVQKLMAVESRGNSWYRALQVSAERPYSRNYSYLLSYTWSRSERDTEDSSFVPQDQTNFAAERGPAASDVRHRLATTLNLGLPLGLRFAAVGVAQSPQPYTITLGTDQNKDGVNNDRPPDTGRNSARGANFRQLDVRLSKTFRAGGREIEALLEGFNVTNRANWTAYQGAKNSPSFGTPRDALPARQIQAGVRVNF